MIFRIIKYPVRRLYLGCGELWWCLMFLVIIFPVRYPGEFERLFVCLMFLIIISPVDILLSLSGLKSLGLGFNNFKGTLPDSLSGSKQISGVIPAGICGFGSGFKLKVLYLQNNGLSGSIPSSLGNCSERVDVTRGLLIMNDSFISICVMNILSFFIKHSFHFD
ncbi:putative non-specific serine/threonine protein kinase [Helianthus anomalus]